MQMQRENSRNISYCENFICSKCGYLSLKTVWIWLSSVMLLRKITPKSIKNAFADGCCAVLTQQIFSSPKAFSAGHIGNMSKGKDEGIGQICTSKPTWFDSRSATQSVRRGRRIAGPKQRNGRALVVRTEITKIPSAGTPTERKIAMQLFFSKEFQTIGVPIEKITDR